MPLSESIPPKRSTQLRNALASGVPYVHVHELPFAAMDEPERGSYIRTLTGSMGHLTLTITDPTATFGASIK